MDDNLRKVYRKDGDKWTLVRMNELKVGDTFKLFGTKGDADAPVAYNDKTEFLVTEEPKIIENELGDLTWSVKVE